MNITRKRTEPVKKARAQASDSRAADSLVRDKRSEEVAIVKLIARNREALDFLAKV